ncbi:MAG: DUF308 domain-containing protein, partial [Butyrivibrio sp.]|uniref:DUF308 domain-containing protein n=1 Tax=Butyrivibrio sp. TaxID=28121 RepID=UPI0025F73152
RTLYHLYLSKWNLYQERTMVFITIIAFFICQFIYFKEHALFIFSNIFLGVVFLMWSYNCACVLKSNKNMPKLVRARYWIEMPIFVILGLFEFVSPQATITTYAVSVGGILVIDGISRLIEYYKA